MQFNKCFRKIAASGVPVSLISYVTAFPWEPKEAGLMCSSCHGVSLFVAKGYHEVAHDISLHPRTISWIALILNPTWSQKFLAYGIAKFPGAVPTAQDPSCSGYNRTRCMNLYSLIPSCQPLQSETGLKAILAMHFIAIDLLQFNFIKLKKNKYD